MTNQKLDNILNLSLSVGEAERAKSPVLSVGYDETARIWELIVRYVGDMNSIAAAFPDITFIPLLGGYALVTLPENRIPAFSANPQVSFIEKPKRLFFAVNQAKTAACIFPLLREPYSLSGNGVLIGIADSGIDFYHEAFRNPDGSSRLLVYWDQTGAGPAPQGYPFGTLYTREDLNVLLRAASRPDGGSADPTGHGTAVAGIAAGNVFSDAGTSYQGVAPEADLAVVRLGNFRREQFPRTTELMAAVDFLVRYAAELNRPLALNLSFGNNYGSHDGTSLLETYLDTVSNLGRCVIVAGTGNEASSANHTSGTFSFADPVRDPVEIRFSVGRFQPSINIQLWKSYADVFSLSLTAPSSASTGVILARPGVHRFRLDRTEVLLYYGEPQPYSISQEIFIDFIPVEDYVQSGIWTITLYPESIVNGTYDLWLPGRDTLNNDTAFLFPTPDTTLTIPSSAANVLSVGAYDSARNSYADFSGRGFTRVTNQIKPDLCASGVNLLAPAPGGGYVNVTGTSFAAPMVTGTAALLMEWGIIKGNDPYLFGQKVKAELIRSARKLPGNLTYPNPQLGYGVLCAADALRRR